MSKVLYVEASPRKQRSASIEVCEAFIETYRSKNPSDEIEKLDVWSLDLPTFGEAALDAKYAGLSGTPLTNEQASAWDTIRRLAAPFLNADKMVFAVPLWNFSIPYRFKHLIDLITQKDILFSFDERGFGGLVKAKRAVVVYARGLDYFSDSSITPRKSYDLQSPYMDLWLRFIGISDIREIAVEKTLLGSEMDLETRTEGKRQAVELARDF
ncbi:FMN-dependent NADH-azoreductase [Bradyrhizobium sp. R2.2-H]|jgi:FMN-dependent NADH-azoreductase|uniref:FMN-dependent NADH-azoreductase n=1 Tax=unclassified Bradyrhizobium TaxID=2631580 RepID=UPI00104BD067|nr:MULTISPECIES: NAD(P)H-dependent oxidoreductase [unclassified Bradyrhizobium]TCU75045.1 FMN-dependent NADH-azoreductase [Bradyrhizobium sp. Y-H1]TCU77813.1 FMN-dependent NADH-azoreductase [Bradyrhizobium sp. R2.2-H]